MRRVLALDRQYEFVRDVSDMETAERDCPHPDWRWLDCLDCRETIGVCGEKVCVACGADLS
jgi:hypothetical protein